jgi:hypothetical protein
VSPQINRPSIVLFVIGLAVCLAVAVSGLFLANALAPHGEVHGTVRICEFGGTYCTAIPGARLTFVRTSDNSKFTAVADSKGWYSIALPAGHFKMPLFIDAGPTELNVVANHQVLADYEVWHLPQ